ncbi:uncharacterized protein B0T15DRAFT_547824 [Chaetomium strumarium]|uniref:Uncharacterized protein n=1 Tax=Chaetomium strumarium TaxID=1170767 RepID=A0AAJ0H3M6_9PEZI|nr:hypothetical protein B0T15DRAFT_547824 [Chaetomium strumarium]
MAHQMPFASRLPEPSKTGWAWGVAANNIRVPQPFMGFYWNMPDDAPCIFSAADQGRDKRKFQRGCVPHRAAIAWDGNRFRAAALTLREKHGSIAQTLTRPRTWEDLYQWFDAYDIWWMGAWNLWLLLHLVCDENEGVSNPCSRSGRHQTNMADVVNDWAYKWCTHKSNLVKLHNWDPKGEGDILDVLGPGDRENIHGCEAKALDVLRGALHHWRQQYTPPAPQGHARRRSFSLPDLQPPSYLKRNPAIVIANRTGAAVRRESSMPGLRVNSGAAQYDTGEHATRAHHQPSKSGPVPAVPAGRFMACRGVGVENAGPSRLPSRPTQQPPPLLNGSVGMRDTRNRSDCRNEGHEFAWSVRKREAFAACHCQRCMHRSRSVYVAPIDQADGVGVENMRENLTRYFERWGHVEEAVAAARKGQAVNPLLARARISHPYYSKHYVRESWSPSKDNRSSWSSNKGNPQEGQSWPDQRYQRRSGDFSALQTTPARPQHVFSPRTPRHALSPYNHTTWACPYSQPGGPSPGHWQNPSPALHGSPPPGHCGTLSQNWLHEAMPAARTPSHSQHHGFYLCDPESPLAARHSSQAQGGRHGPHGDVSMQTKPALEEAIFSEACSSTKARADPACSAAGNASIRVRLPSVLPGKSQAMPPPTQEQETQGVSKADKRHVDIPGSNGGTKDGALGLMKFGDVNSPLPPSGCTDPAAHEPLANIHQDSGNPSTAGVPDGQGHAYNDTAFDWQLNATSRLNTGDIRLDPDYSATVRHRPYSPRRGPWLEHNCYSNSGSWDGNQAKYSAGPYQQSGSWPVRGPQDVASSGQHQAEAGVSSTQPGHRKKGRFKGKHKTSQGTDSHAQSLTLTPVPPAGSDDTAHEQPGPDLQSAPAQPNKTKKDKTKSKAKPKNPFPSSSGDSQLDVCAAQNGGSSTPNPHGAQKQGDAAVGGAASPKKADGVANNKGGYRADAGGSLRIPRKRWGKETTTRVDVRDLFGVREEE